MKNVQKDKIEKFYDKIIINIQTRKIALSAQLFFFLIK